MLILTRKTSETIQIGEDIEVSILNVDGDQVKIGIQAPRSVDIHRKEIFEAIQTQNNQAAAGMINIANLPNYHE